MTDGDQQKADYLLDTNVFNYFYRIVNGNKYAELVKENLPKK